MINSIGSAWRTNLQTGFPPTDRIYSDFRLQEYPDLDTGTAVYSLAREDNLIDRGNCESATAPMMLGETVPVLLNATLARSSDFSHGGDYSFKFTKTVAAGTDAYVRQTDNRNSDDMHGGVAGESYKYSYWFYISTASGILGTECRIRIGEYYGAAWHYTTKSTAANTYDAWQELAGSFTVNADATGFVIWIDVPKTAADTEYFYVDDIRLSTHTVPGSHYLSSGYIETLCAMSEKFTIELDFIPTFAYDTGSNQLLYGWYVSATQYFYITYSQAIDKFQVVWRDGGNARSLLSAQYDDGSAHRNIKQKIKLVAAIDLTTGDTTGSALWMSKTQDDTAWDGNIDAKSTEFNKVQIRAYNGTAGAFNVINVRRFPNLVATDAQVQNDFKDVTNEEIFWSLDGHGTGRTRCNITRFIRAVSTTKNVENPGNGAQSANKCTFSLNNTAGEFSDDQYAAYAPESDQFNGTVDQKYLQRRSNVTIENWYGGDFDTVFFGKLSGGRYARQTANDKFGVVNCGAEDYVSIIARQSVRRGRYWEDADLVDTADEADSLLHLITRLATKKEVYNYLSNSSFENADITLSWGITAGGTLNKDAADGFFGSASGELIPGVANEQMDQTVTFTGKKKLNVGETWTFYVYLKSTAAATAVQNYISLHERDSIGDNDFTTTAYDLAGGEGYTLTSVTHTITDSDSDRLQVKVAADAGDTINIDAAHLIQGERALNYFVLNDNNGVAGVSDADDADNDSYDTIGFDVQDVAITHPWRRVEANESIWDYHKDLGNATVASYMGLNSAGAFRYRSRLSSDYEDPVPMGTMTEAQGIAVEVGSQEANKILVHGVNIVKHGNTQLMWDARASNAFALNTDGTLNEAVADDATWPDTTTYGKEFVAKYGESGEYPEPEEAVEYETEWDTEPQGGFHYWGTEWSDWFGDYNPPGGDIRF